MSAIDEYEDVKQRHRLGSDSPYLAELIAMYADKAIAELEAANKRLQDVAERQATILRGLTEWAETLPEQARDVERAAGEGIDT